MLNAFLVALAVFICVGGAELIGFTMLNRPIVIGPLRSVEVPFANVLVPFARVVAPLERVLAPVESFLVPSVRAELFSESLATPSV